MKYKNLFLLSTATLSSCALSAQSLGIYVESGQIISSEGSLVNFSETVDGQAVNGFYGFVSQDFDFALSDPTTPALSWAQNVLGGIDWSGLVDGTPAGVSWMSPGAELGPANSLTTENSDLAIGTKPVIAFMNAAGPGSLELGSEIAVAVGEPFLSNLDQRPASVEQGSFDVIAGLQGSIEMVSVVPEPAHFAALFGLVGLGLVVIRRRRNR
jgi:hypothetical protein